MKIENTEADAVINTTLRTIKSIVGEKKDEEKLKIIKALNGSLKKEKIISFPINQTLASGMELGATLLFTRLFLAEKFETQEDMERCLELIADFRKIKNSLKK